MIEVELYESAKPSKFQFGLTGWAAVIHLDKETPGEHPSLTKWS